MGAIAVVTFVLLEAQVAAAAAGAGVEAAHRTTQLLYPIPRLYSVILHAHKRTVRHHVMITLGSWF